MNFMIKIGARGSQLSTAQVELVRKQLKTILGMDSEFVPIKSHGDVNTAVPIMKVQQEGAFTSTLETALLQNTVDIAVHSFKDLPTTNPEELEIVAVLKRHNPSDTLVINKNHVQFTSNNDFILLNGTRIGTGSARRQTQLLHYFNDISTIDIRGNVETRLKKLEKKQYDAIVLASAVFERIHLQIPENCIKIELDTQKFPTSPAQGAICIQMKKNHQLFPKIAELDDPETRLAVELERNVLKEIGGGCQLPLGLTVFRGKSSWYLNFTLASQDWRDYNSVPLTKIHLNEHSIEDLESQIKYILPKNTVETPDLANKEILMFGSKASTDKYESFLNAKGAIPLAFDLQEIQTNLSHTLYDTHSQAWLQADWVVVTSKNAIHAVRLFDKYFKKDNLKLASIGFSTTKLLQKNGYAVHFQPSESNAESLAEGLQQILSKDEKILYLSASNAKPTLKTVFENKGYHFTQIEVYSNSEKQNLPQLPDDYYFDYIIVFSPEYARLAIEKYGKNIGKIWLSIGPSTTHKLQELGVTEIRQLKHISNDELQANLL